MADAFQSPRLKLRRAKEHIGHLDTRLKRFFLQRPYSIVEEPDVDGVTQVHKYKFRERIPDKCGVYAADALVNLRSVLDQLGFAVAKLNGVVEPRSAKFPFGDTVADVENDIRRRCKNLPAEIVNLFRSFKPYKSGNDLLWALNKLRNTDHTALVPIAGLTSAAGFNDLHVVGGPVSIIKPIWDREKNEIPFLRVGPGGAVHYNTYMSVSIELDNPAAPTGTPVPALLRAMAGEVQRVITATEAECRRIGLLK